MVLKQITVEPALFFFMLSTYCQYPIFQDLIYHKICIQEFSQDVCDDLYNEENKNALDIVQKKSSYWIFVSSLSIALPTIISSLYLGSWSDKFSRKLAMLFPPFGGILSNSVYLFMSAYEHSPVPLLILGGFLFGICGSYVSFLMSVNSYVAHITSLQARISRISSLEAMTFLGGAVGPFLTGYLKQKLTHTYIFLLLLVFNFIVVIYVLIFVHEVIGNEYQNKKICTACTEYLKPSHIKESILVCFKKRDGNQRQVIILLLLSSFIVLFCNSGESDISFLFAKDKPLKWTYTLYSYYIGTKFAIATATLLFFVPLLKHFSWSDEILTIIGLVSKLSGLVLLSLSTSTVSMFLVPLVSSCSSWCMPCLRGILSKKVLTEESGKTFAFLAILQNCCMLLASLFFNFFYPETRLLWNGLSFIVAAVLLLLPLSAISYIKIKHPIIACPPIPVSLMEKSNMNDENNC